MNVFGSLATTPNIIPPLSDFWYGDYAMPACNSHVEPFLEYGGQYFGFIFCVPSNNARMITTSDQDWVLRHVSIPIMQNIAVNLASPTYTCVASGGLTVNLGPDTAICNGQTVTLNGTTAGASSYLWSNGDTIATVTTNTAGTFWVRVSNGGCSASDTVIISGGGGLLVTVGADTAVCSGAPLQLTASNIPGASYSWTGPQNFSIQNPLIASITTADSGSYTVVASLGSCTSPPVSTHVTVGNGLAAPTVSNNGPLCAGDTLILIADSIAGATYSWTGPHTFSLQNPVLVNAAAADSGLYAVIVTAGNCSSSPVSTRVIINPAPVPPLISATDTVICASDSAQLCITGNFSTYTWNNGAQSPCIYAKSAGNYYATVTNSFGCAAQSANHLAFAVKPVPQISVSINGDTLVCYTPGTYQWYFGGNTIGGATTAIYIAPQSGIYGIMVTGSNGCSAIFSGLTISTDGIAALGSNIPFEVYPSPASSSLIVQTGTDLQSGLQLEILDAIGQRINRMAIANSKTELDISTLSSGAYFVRIGNEVRRFLKK